MLDCGGTGFYLALFALASVLILGILPGLLIAVTLSMLLVLGFFTRPNTAVLGNVPGSADFVSVENDPTAKTTPGLLIFRLDAPLMALNAKRMRDRLRLDAQSASACESGPA